MLHVTGQIESEYLGGGGSTRGVIHEVPKQLQMLDAVSGYAATINRAEDVEADLETAIAHILAAPQGPASVEWPSDLQYLARPDDQREYDLPTLEAPVPDSQEIAEAVTLLSAAKRPLLWVGGGAAGAKAELTAVLRTLGAGLLTSNSGRAIVPEDDPLVIGNFATTPEVAALLADADLLLSIGTHFRSNETKSYHLRLPEVQIQIDVDAAAIGRVYPAKVGIVGDAAATLRAINESLTRTSVDPGWSSRVTDTRVAVRAALTAYIGGYAEICEAMRSVLPRESVVARDVTIPSSQWGNRLLPFYERETNIFPLGGGIGQGLAMGLGAALGRPEVPTAVIAGDGGLAVHLGELASLAGSGAWCVVVIFNDGGYGVLRNMQAANGFDRAGVDLFTPRFDLLAAALDIPYALVQGPGRFEDAFADAVATRGPAIVEVDVAAVEPRPGPFTPPVHIPVGNR
ncbi:acetolactate synthase large subunit [Nocardia camponoti]|uniref:acetolactate synthase n=1 Tax=Nocardia camponoti TaxID=1616106 RepID=A0A917Q8A0_9NOCA|nr:acetolactate synthase large subunit [Nocardia camponoti]